MTIYLVSTTHNLDSLEHGKTDCIGYFTDIDRAVSAIEDNAGDIHELDQDVAILEAADEGLYGCDPDVRRFFTWGHDGRYHEQPWPESLKHVCGFAMG